MTRLVLALVLAPILALVGCAARPADADPPPDAKAAMEAISRDVNSEEAVAGRDREGASLEFGRALEDARRYMAEGEALEEEGEPGRACFFYRQVADLWPGQPIGEKAAERLKACRKAAYGAGD